MASKNLCTLAPRGLSEESKNHTLVQIRKHSNVKFGHQENSTKVLGSVFLFSARF